MISAYKQSNSKGVFSEWQDDSQETHQFLHRYYANTLADAKAFASVPSDLHTEITVRSLEQAWNAYEEDRVSHTPLPKSAQEFVSWYYDIRNAHKGRTDILFDYLANHASLEAMAFFICLEEKVDSRFEDLIVMAQLGVTGRPKLVIGHNYWDEMGEGDYDKIHNVMFERSVVFMKEVLQKAGISLQAIEPVEALKNASILLQYGIRRWYNPRLIGALGILELTAPDRFSAMVKGCQRLGVPSHVIEYQSAHVGIDEDHATEWLNEVLLPMVESSPALMQEICKGILIRYQIATDYYVATRREIAMHLGE